MVSHKKSNQPMNVLFINTDQQRRDAMSCAGNPYLSTPNFDRLAREGVRFTNAVTPSPQCVPARMGFNIGFSSYSHLWFGDGCIPDDCANLGSGTFSQLLTDQGYHAEFYGLWHGPISANALGCFRNAVPVRAFDPWQSGDPVHDLSMPGGGSVKAVNCMKEYKEKLHRDLGPTPKPGPGQYTDWFSGWPYTPDPTDYELRKTQGNLPGHNYELIDYGLSVIPAEHTLTAFKADQAIDALERLKDQPFALTIEFLAPHNPQFVSEPWASSIDPKAMPVPGTLHDRRSNTPYETYSWEYDALEKANIQLLTARYYQMVQEVDYHLGRILKKLDDLGLTSKTLVLLTSDHGEMLGDHGLQQKGLPYREAIHPPLLIRLPGVILEGKTVDSFVNLIDIPATILDYTGIPIPRMEGRSLRPLVEGKSDGRREFTISETGGSQFLMHCDYVSRDWKYAWFPDASVPDMLFDLTADPEETDNLLGSNPNRPEYLSTAESIRNDMLGWMEEINHPFKDALAESEIK